VSFSSTSTRRVSSSSLRSLTVISSDSASQELEEASKPILERLKNGPSAADPDADEPSYETHLEDGEEEEEVEMPTRSMASASLKGELFSSSSFFFLLQLETLSKCLVSDLIISLSRYRNRLSDLGRSHLQSCPSLATPFLRPFMIMPACSRDDSLLERVGEKRDETRRR